jgi:twitching motility protein PilT
MIKIQDLLQDASALNSNELRIVSGVRPQIRTRKGWHYCQQEILAPTWVREQILGLLDEEERVRFLDQSFFNGSLTSEKRNYRFVLSRTADGFHAHFTWENESIELESFSLPPAVIEIFKKAQGLSLISGPRGSGRTTLSRLLAQEVGKEGYQSIAVFCDDLEEYKGHDAQVFPLELLSSGPSLLRGFDFVIVDSLRFQAWRHAVTLAEVGIRVLVVLPFPTARAAIDRLSEKLESDPQVGRRRLLECLQMILSIRLIPALEKGMHSAYELIMMTSEIRTALLAGEWNQVEKAMHDAGEKTGMRTLNHCLMNLMLKRKIDLKAGFAESPSPQELDAMLDRLGF